MSADNQWKARHLREGRELLRNSIERMNRYGVAVETCDAVTEHQLARILDRLESCRRCLGHLIDECETKTHQRLKTHSTIRRTRETIEAELLSRDCRAAIQRARESAWGQEDAS